MLVLQQLVMKLMLQEVVEMKQVTWQSSTGRAYPVFRDNPGDPWQPIRLHPGAVGETIFAKYQSLLKQGYEAI